MLNEGGAREASVRRHRTRGRGHALRAFVTRSRRDADAPQAPVGAPLPHAGEGKLVGELLSRGNEDVLGCSVVTPGRERSSRARD